MSAPTTTDTAAKASTDNGAQEAVARAACVERIKLTANYKLTKEPVARSNLGVGDTFEFRWLAGDLVTQTDFGVEAGTQAECSGSFAKHAIENLTVDGKTYITPSQPFPFGG